MPPSCLHGYPADGCLICQTLTAGEVARPRPTKAAPTVGPRPARGRRGVGQPARGRQGVGLPSAVLVVVAIVAVVGVVWAVAGLVFAILRLVELLAAVVVAGWVGYKVGVARGRREG